MYVGIPSSSHKNEKIGVSLRLRLGQAAYIPAGLPVGIWSGLKETPIFEGGVVHSVKIYASMV